MTCFGLKEEEEAMGLECGDKKLEGIGVGLAWGWFCVVCMV